MIIPVTFRPVILGEGVGQMSSDNSSIWTQIGFKIVQFLIFCHTSFISLRTFEYISGGGGSGMEEKGNLDWDFVPMMLIFTVSYVIVQFLGYLIFDSGQLNKEVYNEILKLRGKKYTNF